MGKYARGIGKQFVVWYCKLVFEEGVECVDGICGQCKIMYTENGHSCSICNQKICDFKDEYNQGMMQCQRDNWVGPGPEFCAIRRIEL